jgi:hypothetical protein
MTTNIGKLILTTAHEAACCAAAKDNGQTD